VNASTLFDIDKLIALVGEGYINCIKHPNNEYFMYTTTRQAELRWLPSEWPDEAIFSQGLICDKNWNIIARPFAKIFDWDEFEGAIPVHDTIKIVERLPGTLCIMYKLPDGKVEFATKNGFDTPEAKTATAMFHENYTHTSIINPMDLFTPCFQLVGGVHLSYLGCINKTTGIGMDIANERHWVTTGNANSIWTGSRPLTLTLKALDAIETMDRDSSGRGFILVISNRFYINMHFEDLIGYLRVQSVTPKLIWEHCKLHVPLDELSASIPPEFHGWLNGIRYDLARKYLQIADDADEIYEKMRANPEIKDERTFAMAIAGHPLKNILFAMKNSKNVSGIIWDMVKPKSEDPYKTASVMTIASQLTYI